MLGKLLALPYPVSSSLKRKRNRRHYYYYFFPCELADKKVIFEYIRERYTFSKIITLTIFCLSQELITFTKF